MLREMIEAARYFFANDLYPQGLVIAILAFVYTLFAVGLATLIVLIIAKP